MTANTFTPLVPSRSVRRVTVSATGRGLILVTMPGSAAASLAAIARLHLRRHHVRPGWSLTSSCITASLDRRRMVTHGLAWGGGQPVLSPSMRVASAGAAVVWLAGLLVVLRRGGMRVWSPLP